MGTEHSFIKAEILVAEEQQDQDQEQNETPVTKTKSWAKKAAAHKIPPY